MKPKTKEFLRACKDVGYEVVTIFVRDKRVPATKKFKNGSWFGDGREIPFKVVAAYPPKYCENKKLGGEWAAMRQVVTDCGLDVGISSGGAEDGDAHDIAIEAIDWMDEGCYVLKDLDLGS